MNIDEALNLKITCVICGEAKGIGDFQLRHKGKFSDRCSACQKTHPKYDFETRTSAKVKVQHYRALGYGVISTLTYEEWMEILRISGGRCFHCKRFVGIELLVLDHLVPISRQGPNTADNVVAACKSCNESKGALLVDEWICTCNFDDDLELCKLCQYILSTFPDETAHLLKFLASLYQESMVELLDRLANEELQKAKDRGSITNFP